MSKNTAHSFVPPSVSNLSTLAIDVWRLEKKINKIMDSVGKDDSIAIKNSVEKIKSYLEKEGIEVIDLEGHKYNEGLNVDVLSIVDEKKKTPVISETIEPMVRHDSKIIKKSKVIVTK